MLSHLQIVILKPIFVVIFLILLLRFILHSYIHCVSFMSDGRWYAAPSVTPYCLGSKLQHQHLGEPSIIIFLGILSQSGRGNQKYENRQHKAYSYGTENQSFSPLEKGKKCSILFYSLLSNSLLYPNYFSPSHSRIAFSLSLSGKKEGNSRWLQFSLLREIFFSHLQRIQ